MWVIISSTEQGDERGRRTPRVLNSSVPVSLADVKALRDFLESQHVRDEKLLQRLLERHPALIGPLGFGEFVSEFPLYKVGRQNAPDLSDLRRRDRADIIAASASPISPSYRAANIIELKSAAMHIAEREVRFTSS